MPGASSRRILPRPGDAPPPRDLSRCGCHRVEAARSWASGPILHARAASRGLCLKRAFKQRNLNQHLRTEPLRGPIRLESAAPQPQTQDIPRAPSAPNAPSAHAPRALRAPSAPSAHTPQVPGNCNVIEFCTTLPSKCPRNCKVFEFCTALPRLSGLPAFGLRSTAGETPGRKSRRRRRMLGAAGARIQNSKTLQFSPASDGRIVQNSMTLQL